MSGPQSSLNKSIMFEIKAISWNMLRTNFIPFKKETLVYCYYFVYEQTFCHHVI